MTRSIDEEGWEHNFANSQDIDILLHREAHFGGSFDVMIDYYTKEGKGCSPAIDLERVIELAEKEKKSGENLAVALLSEGDEEKITRIREMYKNLRQIYEADSKENPIPTLIADLILSEDHDTTKIVESFLPYKLSATPALIEVLRNLDFYDPLFPGYGFAPEIAAECLAKIGDRKAIIALFEAIGDGDFFHDEGVLHALKAIGEPAKEFLLKVLQGRPLNEDNEKAAIALECFKGDESVGKVAVDLLQAPDVIKDPIFATYLVYLCEGLPAATFKEPLDKLSQSASLSKDLKRDIKVVLSTLA